MFLSVQCAVCSVQCAAVCCSVLQCAAVCIVIVHSRGHCGAEGMQEGTVVGRGTWDVGRGTWDVGDVSAAAREEVG